MSRLTGNDALGLFEAYLDVYNPQEPESYNIILSYLLDEGYTNSLESAQVIIENMSEEWGQSIVEAYKSWDFGPKQKAKEKYNKLKAQKEAGGSAPGTATRANKIASVAREMRTTLDDDSAMTMTNPKKQGLQPSTRRHTDAALRGAGEGTTARTKFDVKPLTKK